MRDILLVAFLFVAIVFTFKRPFIGVLAWIWIALMAPTSWAFGFSQEFRLNFTIVIVTILAYLIAKEKKTFTFTSIHFWVFLFGFWMLISTIFSPSVDPDFVWSKLVEFLKIICLFLFITLLVNNRVRIEALVWAILLGISAYAAMEAVKFILSAGSHRIVGRAGIIEDRNDIAVAINMCLPLVIYLWSITKNKWLKQGLLALTLLNVVAIVGTYSRGGFIGLSILLLAIWLHSNKKFIFLLLALMVLPVAISFAPEDWIERQNTIETAVTEDGSFIGRLWAWKIATLIALDNPLTGGGFKATTDQVLWHTYAPLTPDFGPVATPPIPPTVRPKAAHNIYFQVLASSGFVGLFIFLMILLSGLLVSRNIAKRAKALNVEWCKNLANGITLTLIGYGITGLNVSLAYFDLLYAILGLICMLKLEISKIEEQQLVQDQAGKNHS